MTSARVPLGAAVAAAEDDDVLRRFVTLAPKVAWTPESRLASPPQLRGEDIVNNFNADTYPRASRASKVAVRYADRIYVQITQLLRQNRQRGNRQSSRVLVGEQGCRLQEEEQGTWYIEGWSNRKKCGGITDRMFRFGELSLSKLSFDGSLQVYEYDGRNISKT